ncbi:MAG: flagellar hook-associated protein FlgK [Armatimonadota bacterium]
MAGWLGLDIALGALRANQLALDVTAHNIANAGTKGFHRQEAILKPGSALSGAFAANGLGVAQLGAGVVVAGIRRVQTDYIDAQARIAMQWLGMWDARSGYLNQVESLLAEPSEGGLSAVIERFWNAWEELSASPESTAARINVVETGRALAERIRTLNYDLTSLRSRIDRDVADSVSEINRLAHEIAELNNQISYASPAETQPSDLLDKRGILLDELSTLARVQISEGIGAQLVISLGGRALVQGGSVLELATRPGTGGRAEVVWSDNGSSVQVTSGRLAGQIGIRDELIGGYLADLDTIALTLADKVNALHSTGLTRSGTAAGEFFTVRTGSADIDVRPELVTNPDLVATSTTGRAGDNSLAVAIAALRSTPMIGSLTIGGAYAKLVAQVGSHTRESNTRKEVQSLVLEQLEYQRQSAAGVSLDEEMVNITKFQQAYTAAARMVTTIDEMLDTIINRMGLTGR